MLLRSICSRLLCQRPTARTNFFFIKRNIRFELPDEENERDAVAGDNSKESFEETFRRLKLPYKLRHKDRLEESKQFIKLRLEQYPRKEDGESRMAPLKMEDYAELYEGLEDGDEREKTIKAIELVVDYYNRILSRSLFCPSTVPVADMKKILTSYDSYNARIRYLHFLFVREFDVWRLAIAEEKSRAEHLQKEAEELATFTQIGCFKNEANSQTETAELQYGFWRNTLFTRYFTKAVAQYSLHRLRVAEQFGQPLIVDCSFDETMADYETSSVGRQISSIYHANRYAPADTEPFRLLFTGYREANRGYRYAFKQMREVISNRAYCFNLHSQPYEELFSSPEDRERLVYLSPDARQLMTEFDPQAIYIVGALVSKTHKSEYSFEKARAQGIKCLRLPIHNYIELKPGVKRVLSFQGVFKILLELKRGHGDWERALREGILPHKIKGSISASSEESVDDVDGREDRIPLEAQKWTQ